MLFRPTYLPGPRLGPSASPTTAPQPQRSRPSDGTRAIERSPGAENPGKILWKRLFHGVCEGVYDDVYNGVEFQNALYL